MSSSTTTPAPVTAPATAAVSTGPLPMRPNAFADLADQVAQVLDEHGIAVYFTDDRQALDQALWEFIHPDLADSAANPYAGCDAIAGCTCRNEYCACTGCADCDRCPCQADRDCSDEEGS
ncbi:hypothetical protein [Actinomadura kijaniata]|uniref:hypothetical protein n=1 Tax=Actinomadura kijaniata TaxID=46161 RepID=UPI00082F294B|nr:hypothetical protein [Actinomadura kijaniata]